MSLYAVIVTGGKQYRVVEGQSLKVEKLATEPGGVLEFDQVLMIANGTAVQVGVPYVPEAKVQAFVVSHGRGEKIKILKMKRRKHHRKHMGHRQWYTEIKITGIMDPIASAA